MAEKSKTTRVDVLKIEGALGRAQIAGLTGLPIDPRSGKSFKALMEDLKGMSHPDAPVVYRQKLPLLDQFKYCN